MAPTEVDLTSPPATATAETSRPIERAAQATADGLPVGPDDAVWGASDAPVTIVLFTDYQCPFSARVQPTLDELRRANPEHSLRIVVKHNPLPFHREALPAAHAAQAVLLLAGDPAFFDFSARLYAQQQDLTPELFEREAVRLDISRRAFRAALEDPRVVQKVVDDMALARRIGVRGTPVFRINGVEVSGARPLEAFTTVVVAERLASLLLIAEGTPAKQVYARRVVENLEVPDGDGGSAAETGARSSRDTTVWAIPVGKSPVRGPATALVTIVEFVEFQCPFCKRAEATLDELERRYPGELRFVFKHHPMPFHPRAMPAAMLAMEARRQRGVSGFWDAADRLWDSTPALEDPDLETIARSLRLNVPATMQAIASEAHRGEVEEDMELAADFEARGTPHFFINGHRLAGAQPIERFVEEVEARLVEARALLASGVPRTRIYEEVLKRGKGPPRPEILHVPPPTVAEPSRGPRGAPVVLTLFSDFQCPFCRRIEPTLDALLQEFPTELRVVWRDLPLEFHHHAKLASEAAREAFAQRGNPGFWAMHDLLFQHQADPGGLERPALESYASQIGLNLGRFRAALDQNRHTAAVEASANVANQAGIHGTPTSVVNGYLVSGADSLQAFRRAVRLALADHRSGMPP
ncbi:MAG: thioredoxin domain-containing protein [Polyangiaceae bacterium]|nr:thioredoxin domain-containing protein [Polyangiaceae bacterium]